MPTYRIKDPDGKILDAAVQADSEFSAAAPYNDIQVVVVEEVSPNPPATVYTIAFPLETVHGIELVEVGSTGSRPTALSEMARERGNGHTNRTLIEESREVNRQQAKGRRS